MHGLYLLVRPDGARYWRMDYRLAGKRGTLALGVYPQVSLKEAREKRTNARKLLDKSVNPSASKKLTRGVSAIGAGDTFEIVAAEWLGKLAAEGSSPSTMKKMTCLLDLPKPPPGRPPIVTSPHPRGLTSFK